MQSNELYHHISLLRRDIEAKLGGLMGRDMEVREQKERLQTVSMDKYLEEHADALRWVSDDTS